MESISYEDVFMEKIEKGYFDPMKVNEYYQQQIPYNLNYDGKYLDKTFPPEKNSILSISQDGVCLNQYASLNPLIDHIEFRRADEIFGTDWEIFQGKIEIDDIKQGSLGNCYFLSAIASLVIVNPHLIYQLFRIRSKNQKNFEYKNYFEVVFFIEGRWQVVIIDDFFITYKKIKNI